MGGGYPPYPPPPVSAPDILGCLALKGSTVEALAFLKFVALEL